MEKSTEVYIVAKCPLCGEAHKYSLTVLRSSFLYSTSDISPKKHIRRLFTCPAKGEDFEGNIVLLDKPTNKITSVTVDGLIEEEK